MNPFLDKYTLGDIIALYDHCAISGGECSEMLEDYILSRNGALQSEIEQQYDSFLCGNMTMGEYCDELYLIGVRMDHKPVKKCA